jgi:hypothetical protein
MAWCGIARIWYDAVCHSMVWCMVWYGKAWCGTIYVLYYAVALCDIVWYNSMVWCFVVWIRMV